MKRLVVKYERFIQIMIDHPGQVAVPTLDVDLAWHTHQLSPRTYLDFTIARAGQPKFSVQTRDRKLIDHDDKINEDKLSSAFEWTSKTYQEMFGEVYSECTCWYCEAVRCSHVNSVGKALGVSKNEKSKLYFQHKVESSNEYSRKRLSRFWEGKALSAGLFCTYLCAQCYQIPQQEPQASCHIQGNA